MMKTKLKQKLVFKKEKQAISSLFTKPDENPSEEKSYLLMDKVNKSFHSDYIEQNKLNNTNMLRSIKSEYMDVSDLHNDISLMVSDQSDGIIKMNQKLNSILKNNNRACNELRKTMKIQKKGISFGVKFSILLTFVLLIWVTVALL